MATTVPAESKLRRARGIKDKLKNLKSDYEWWRDAYKPLAGSTAHNRLDRLDRFLKIPGAGLSWIDRFDTAVQLIDKESRAAASFDLMKDLAVKLINKAFKVKPGLSHHPYLILHKPHFELFKQILEVASALQEARKYREEAARSVGEIVGHTNEVADAFQFQRGPRWKEYQAVLQELKNILELIDASLAQELAHPRQLPPEYLPRWVEMAYECTEYQQILLSELAFDYAMLRVDQAGIDKLMRLYRQKVKKMKNEADTKLMFVAGKKEDEYDKARGVSAHGSNPDQRVNSAVSRVSKCVHDWDLHTKRLMRPARGELAKSIGTKIKSLRR